MESRKELEELARLKGVVLASPAPPVAPAAGDRGAPKSKGFLARAMPNAADLMADMKQQLGPFYPAALANLQRGAGYLVDEETRLAVGQPPIDEYQRGKVDEREGWTVMRVRRVSLP